MVTYDYLEALGMLKSHQALDWSHHIENRFVFGRYDWTDQAKYLLPSSYPIIQFKLII